MVTASPNSQRHTYSYDGIGTRRSLDASGAGRFTSVYDLAGQLTSLRNPYSERTTFSYDDSGRRTVQRNANGTRVSTAYDAASQTSQVIHRPAAGSPLLQLDYRYDNAGNRKVLIEGGGTARVTWSYDAQNQLTGEHRTGTNAYRQTYTFDPAGNRTLKNLGGTRTTYGYDSANQLRYGQAVAGRTTFQYDLTGNQRIEQPPTGNRTTTTWNYENQPTQYRLPTGSPVTMAYNGDNRRISLQQGATTTKFVWDSVIDAYVKELDGSNVVQAVYTSEPQHYGAVLSQRRGSTSHVLHADALGTTRLLTTSAGASSDTYLYDAWGNLITSSGTTVNPFRWVGRYGYYMDQSTGIVYVRARMYLPTVARWASVDPPYGDDLVLYNYVTFGTPLWTDPSGFSTVSSRTRSGSRLLQQQTPEFDPDPEPQKVVAVTNCRIVIEYRPGDLRFEFDLEKWFLPYAIVPGDCGVTAIEVSGQMRIRIVSALPLFKSANCARFQDSAATVVEIKKGGACRSRRECPQGEECKLDPFPWEQPLRNPSIIWLPDTPKLAEVQCLLTIEVKFENLKITHHTGCCVPLKLAPPDFDD